MQSGALLICYVLVLFSVVLVHAKHKDSSYAPEQIHLSYGTADCTAMTVSWVTRHEADSLVLFGIGQELGNEATGSSRRYTFNKNEKYKSPVLHSATLTNLAPSTVYHFECGDKQLGLSARSSFTTPPAVGDGLLEQGGYVLGLVGDLGQTEDSAVTVRHILEDPIPLAVLHAGDLSYADCEQDRWDSYGRLAEPAASRIPWMTAAGNHEIELEGPRSTARAFVAYEARYNMPAVRPPVFENEQTVLAHELAHGRGAGASALDCVSKMSKQQQRSRQTLTQVFSRSLQSCTPSQWLGRYDYGNSFYSFNVATTHVVVLNPYTPSFQGSEQHNWLSSDLAAVDRALTPWVVVVTHCPWYSSNRAHQLETQTVAMQAGMEDLLVQSKVAIVFSGHVHAYERSHRMHSWSRTEAGIVYVVVGDGGNREGHASGYYPLPHWSAKRDGQQFGHGRLRVANSTHSHWEWRPNESGDAVVGDAEWIVNPWRPSAV